jgi:hypothetical protein
MNIHSRKSIMLFTGILLLNLACEESSLESAKARFTKREITIGQTSAPPQFFSYSSVWADNVFVLVNKIDQKQPAALWEDMYVEKYNSDGIIVWSKRYLSDFGMIGRSISTTSEGDIVVAASVQKSGSFGDDNITVIRLTSDGEELWRRTFPGGFFELPVDIIELANKNIMIDFLLADGSYLLHLDADGNEIGRLSKTEFGCANGVRIFPTDDGGFTVGSPNPAKVSVDGTVQFCQDINEFSCTEPIFRSAALKPISSDLYVMLGSVAYLVPNDCNVLARSDLFISLFDGAGTALTSKTIDLAGKDFPKNIDVTQEGILLLSDGTSGDDMLDQKVYLVKLRHDLSEEWRERLNYSSAGFNQALTLHAISNTKYAMMVNTRSVNNSNEIKLVILTETE